LTFPPAAVNITASIATEALLCRKGAYAYAWIDFINSFFVLIRLSYYDIMPRRTGDGIINLAEMSVFSLHWLNSE
jgi:hypothetical protein